MNLKNPDLFRSWLIRQLEPICKANPEPVSKYVCALLKKEKSDGELRESLVSQLYIFLDTATEEFVTFLIDVLKDDKYMTNETNFHPAEETKSENEDNVELKIETELEPTPEKEKERKSPSPIKAPSPSPPRKTIIQRSFSPRSRRNRNRNERRRIPLPRRSRRDNSSHSNSPPTAAERRQTIRKRSASGSSESSNKSPRRSWIASRPSDAKKYKHRHFSRISPPGARSRSPSPPPRMRKRRPANGNFRKRLPQPNSRSNSEDERHHNSPIKRVPPSFINDVPDLPPAMIAKADLPIIDSTQPPPPSFGQKQRCVDFESKGYCARGDMCPFDHGPSPIVLDNNILNGIVPMPPPPVHHASNFPDSISYTPQFVNAPNFQPAKSFRSENPPPVSNRELISVPTVSFPPVGKNMPHGGKPSFGHVFSSLPPGVSQTTIELTNVPAELNNIPDLYDNFSTFGSLTLIQAKRNNNASVALLTFSNATEAALAFINVDSTAMPNVKPAWYADRCIMNPYPLKSIPAGGQANNAKSYVINRKVPPLAASAITTAATTAAAASPAPNPAAVNAKSITSPPDGAVAKTTELREKQSPSAAITVSTEEKIRAANEKMRQDPGRLLSDLIKKKRELLEKQLASRKEIVEKMKSLEAGSKDEKTWQEVLRKLNDVIVDNENSIKLSLQQRKEYLQKMNIVPMDSAALNSLKSKQHMAAAAAAAANAAAIAATSSSATAAVAAAAPILANHTLAAKETQHQTVSSATRLDRAEGFDSNLGDSLEEHIFDPEEFSVLDQELEDEEDEDEVESMTVTAAISTTPTKSSQNASVVDTSCANSSSRPAAAAVPEYTRLVVSGFENGDEDDLLQHFSKFGTILDKEFDNTIPSATLIYDSRRSAEEAKKEGRNFQDRLLSVTVYSSKKYQPFVKRSTANASNFKTQYEKEYSYVSYAAAGGGVGGGSNPYKYKNPQITAVPPAPRISGHRNVYSFRAESKARVVNAKTSQVLFVNRGAAENNSAANVADEDGNILSDDNLVDDID